MIRSDNYKTVLERIAARDKTAVEECIDQYGSRIWKAVISRVQASDSAENLVLDIFSDIWKYSDRFDSAQHTEERFISLLVHRRLIANNKRRHRTDHEKSSIIN